ncbi:Guanine nucleotide-binding protein-like 3-like protein [Clydaea vesicula]|uniref:Guanine nucleotide-binding protein-like 3-like protein n=1 Tax=Clydaea vesicula TaxID=447962 RepID=A0AAD5U6C8_9FUNG|nr:Guanine nucleotide-binding protein-like 3-like protein [Clydaea vesicula]
MSEALEKQEEFELKFQEDQSEESEQQESSVGKKDDSRKAYFKEFKKVVEESDVILEILDCRDPLGGRTKQIEEMILNSGINKRIILILNKIDLVPRETVEQWLKYLRNEFPTIAFKASTQNQKNLSHNKVSTKHASSALLSSSECLGADTLLKLLKNYCRNNQIKTSITVGVVGFPNVGKSSVINSLKRQRVCSVGSTPGITKSNQEIHLDKNIKLLDSPGIVFSKAKNAKEAAEAILRNSIKVELVDDPVTPVELILTRCKKEHLMVLYNIPYFDTVQDFLIQIAKQKGRIRKGGIPDLENSARCVLQDWNQGKIPYFTTPPKDSGAHVESLREHSLVDSWSKEFEIDGVIKVEKEVVLNGVKSRSDIATPLFGIQSSGIVDLPMDEGNSEDEDMEDDESEEDSDEDDEDENMDED